MRKSLLTRATRFGAVLIVAVAALVATACTYTYRPSAEHCTKFSYGDQTHVLFDFQGPDEAAKEMWEAADHGISDDARVQRFVNALVVELESRNFGTSEQDSTRDYLWLKELGEPRTIWGPLSEAKRIADPEGKEEFLYRWTDSAGNTVITLSEREFRGDFVEIGASAMFGRKGGPHGGDCIKVSVSSPQRGYQARPAIDYRNAGSMIYGVMGIVVQRDEAELPPGLVLDTTVTISASSRTDPQLLDEIVIAALNQSLSPDEIVQFYRHATLEEPGDSDERVTNYITGVSKAVLIKRPEGK